ncbi:hypothetical protein D3C75_1172270 [compost metagenome]
MGSSSLPLIWSFSTLRSLSFRSLSNCRNWLYGRDCTTGRSINKNCIRVSTTNATAKKDRFH